ncbi:hypothetical protein DKX38_018577 [Salix brachista]|uniref:Uncharacterized protein n=1 Tax=Salix brachista TaxID=2182728 RepID=A0A5N5KNJ2_9ROSI|nr:hypothetical protein DKX38_018577 [Salix brachista]
MSSFGRGRGGLVRANATQISTPGTSTNLGDISGLSGEQWQTLLNILNSTKIGATEKLTGKVEIALDPMTNWAGMEEDEGATIVSRKHIQEENSTIEQNTMPIQISEVATPNSPETVTPNSLETATPNSPERDESLDTVAIHDCNREIENEVDLSGDKVENLQSHCPSLILKHYPGVCCSSLLPLHFSDIETLSWSMMLFSSATALL